MVFGGSFDENSFQLDGVNVTDNYFNEGFSEPNPDGWTSAIPASTAT